MNLKNKIRTRYFIIQKGHIVEVGRSVVGTRGILNEHCKDKEYWGSIYQSFDKIH